MPQTSHSKTTSKTGFVITAVLCAGAVFGVARYVQVAHADKVPAYEHRAEADQAPSSEITPQRVQAAPDAGSTRAFVFTPEWHGSTLKFSRSKVAVPEGSDPKVFVV